MFAYNKELAYVVMEVQGPQDLQSELASWKHRGTDGEVPVRVCDWRQVKTNSFLLSPFVLFRPSRN